MARRSKIGAAKAVPRHFLRDLHHLFLIDDDALGFLQDVVDQSGAMSRGPKGRS